MSFEYFRFLCGCLFFGGLAYVLIRGLADISRHILSPERAKNKYYIMLHTVLWLVLLLTFVMLIPEFINRATVLFCL